MLPILNAQRNIGEIFRLASQDVSLGVLHYLLLHFWIIAFGTSEVALRGLSFLFHILTCQVKNNIVQNFDQIQK